MPRKIHAKSTQNSRSFRIQAAGGKINFCSQDLVALSDFTWMELTWDEWVVLSQ